MIIIVTNIIAKKVARTTALPDVILNSVGRAIIATEVKTAERAAATPFNRVIGQQSDARFKNPV